MANAIHPNSKAAMFAFARKSIAAQCRMLMEVGATYEEVERELHFHPRKGMTVWELVNKKKK